MTESGVAQLLVPPTVGGAKLLATPTVGGAQVPAPLAVDGMQLLAEPSGGATLAGGEQATPADWRGIGGGGREGAPRNDVWTTSPPTLIRHWPCNNKRKDRHNKQTRQL